eukprot:2534434-Pleurochrysis_carterae.AAC.1
MIPTGEAFERTGVAGRAVSACIGVRGRVNPSAAVRYPLWRGHTRSKSLRYTRMVVGAYRQREVNAREGGCVACVFPAAIEFFTFWGEALALCFKMCKCLDKKIEHHYSANHAVGCYAKQGM